MNSIKKTTILLFAAVFLFACSEKDLLLEDQNLKLNQEFPVSW